MTIETVGSVHDRTNDNLFVQLLKAADSDGAPFQMTFMDETTMMFDGGDAKTVLGMVQQLKAQERLKVINNMQASRQKFLASVHKLIT